MGVPAIFEKQIEIKLLHSASTEGVTDSGTNQLETLAEHHVRSQTTGLVSFKFDTGQNI
jgi:hypothetical protein